MTARIACLLLAAAAAPSAMAQFDLYVVNGLTEQPVPAVYDMGSIYPGETAVARFRLRNTSNAPAAVTVLSAAGSGFSLAGGPTLPVGLDPQAAIEFSVSFQSTTTGTFSAALTSQGVSTLLTATVLPRLTYLLDNQVLGSVPVDFGTVQPGAGATRHLTVQNGTGQPLIVPAIAVTGDAFSLAGPSPSGTILLTGQIAGLDIRFQPSNGGPASGALVVGDRSYALKGVLFVPSLPKLLLSFDRAQWQSNQKGVLTISFDAAAQIGGEGAVSLAFQPLMKNASDTGVQFSAGGSTLSFTVSPGDTQAAAQFQTGTTAGTLTLSVTLGDATATQSITIDPAAIVLTAVTGTRTANTIEVHLTGFDNSRSAGTILYDFYDTAGNKIPPGDILIDNTADFAKLFSAADATGQFDLRSIFPVTGDTSRIAAFEVRIANAIAATPAPRTPF